MTAGGRLQGSRLEGLALWMGRQGIVDVQAPMESVGKWVFFIGPFLLRSTHEN